MRAKRVRRQQIVRAARLLRDAADRLEPPRRVVTQPGFAPLVRIGGRWWRREELQPLSLEEPGGP